jgi:hydrogenase maturation factor
MPIDGSEIILCNRKISTYINALAKAGFVVEQMAEQTDKETIEAVEDVSDKTKKAKMLPISFCIKARKL